MLKTEILKKLASIADELDTISLHSEASAITNFMMRYSQANVNLLTTPDRIKNWQNHLVKQGYNINVDGVFGPQTKEATIDYQRKNGLTADGVVGQNTLMKAGLFVNPGTSGGGAQGAQGAQGGGGQVNTEALKQTITSLFEILKGIVNIQVKPLTPESDENQFKNFLESEFIAPAKLAKDTMEALIRQGAQIPPGNDANMLRYLVNACLSKVRELSSAIGSLDRRILAPLVGAEMQGMINEFGEIMQQMRNALSQLEGNFTVERYQAGRDVKIQK